MIITDYKLHSQQELFDIIRRTHLAGDETILPFHDAKISIQTVSYRDLVPTQTFVLNDQLANIYNIHTQMLRKGIDIFKLRGFLSYQIDRLNSANSINENDQKTAENNSNIASNLNGGLDSAFVFTPPIIEVIDNQPLVIDGQHRITYAKDNSITFNALIIENIASDVWPYQLPIAGGWDAVQRFNSELPAGFVRKQRRYPTSEMNKFFFREYPFPGIIKLMRAHSGKQDGR